MTSIGERARATIEVDWVRLSSVNLPCQELLEGLAQAIPLFVASDDAPLITRVRIEHDQQLVRAELHQMINAGSPIDDCATHAHRRIPWWTSNDIAKRAHRPQHRPVPTLVLMAFPGLNRLVARLAETADVETIKRVPHGTFERPLSPTDLVALWPAAPAIGDSTLI